MRPSRADVFPMLVIMAGGAIGALLTLSPVLLFGPIDDVLAPVPATELDGELGADLALRAGHQYVPDLLVGHAHSSRLGTLNGGLESTRLADRAAPRDRHCESASAARPDPAHRAGRS